MDAETRRIVRLRAGGRCEYCGVAQAALPFVTFHIEHIIPRQHGGSDEIANLALSCVDCNRHKGPNLAGIDPESGQLVFLFNPREQRWEDHFQRNADLVVGRTPVGRATVRVLAMNSPARLQTRDPKE